MPKAQKKGSLDSVDVLSWIDFGQVSAERDDLLGEYFYDNGVLQRIIEDSSSFLILGRKGAGKTAVFRHLAQRPYDYMEKNDVLVSLSFEDYNWNVHRLLSNEATADSLAYRQSWKFVVLVEAIKAITRKISPRKMPPLLREATALLARLFDHPIPSITQLIGQKLLTLTRLKLPTGGFDGLDLDGIQLTAGEISFEAVRSDRSLQEALNKNVGNLISIFERAIKSAPKGVVYVCFDRVDEAWDEISVESSKRVIAGLVGAADSITSELGQHVRPIVFLREDIFNVLSLNDSNKLREDCGQLLKWDRESLFKLMLVRVNYFARRAGVGFEYRDIADLFDKREMRQRAKPENYFIKRTMMRPRDLICFFSRTAQAMRDQAEDPFQDAAPAYERLQTAAVYDAEPGYSEWLSKEIVDEWRAHKPNLTELLAILQNNGSTHLKHEQFESALRKTNKALKRSEVIAELRFLYDNSIIGVPRVAGPSLNWRFRCFHESQGFVEASEYRIHEGLVRALNLVEPREREGEAQ